MFKGNGPGRKRREAMAERNAEACGAFTHRLHHYPSQMSRGQQQSGNTRAFVSRPEVVFADEPTGNLDTKTTGGNHGHGHGLCQKI